MKKYFSLSAPSFAAFCLMAISVNDSIFAGEVTLKDNSLRVAFDTHSGALTRLENKTTHWIIERRPELGVSFRLHAPLPDRRDNFVLGQKQRAVEVKKLTDNQVRLQWRNLISEHGGVLPMTLTSIVTLTNGTLTFDATLENNSPLSVETIDYPYFGDFNPPPRDTPLEVRTMRNGRNNDSQSNEIYPHFHNEKGYWGVFYPTKALESKQSFCLIQAPHEGLCVGINNATLPYRLQYTFEQHPGVISSINDLVPQQDEISGLPVHLEFRTCHFIFAHPHSTANLVPVVLRCYNGDWHAGIDLYKQTRSLP